MPLYKSRMQKVPPIWWKLLCFAGILWSSANYVRRWFTEGQEMIAGWEFSHGIIQDAYLGLALLGCAAIAALNWGWIYKKLCKATIAEKEDVCFLLSLAGDTQSALEIFNAIRDKKSRELNLADWSRVQAQIVSLSVKARRINLPYPKTKHDDSRHLALEKWRTYCMFLRPLAEIGDIHLARKMEMDGESINLPFDTPSA